MTPFDIAKGYIGTKEIAGSADNPTILEMYAAVGHDWVEHDEVAWCAAFVGFCLEKAGVRSTRKLNARSYLQWGIAVRPEDAQRGDIAVIPRGGAKSWQGHVFFVDRIEGDTVYGLGGNQDNAVNIKPFRLSQVLGFRRMAGVGPSVMPGVADVQRRLRDLGYHEVGQIDGKMGPRTRGAILAFKADNGLRLNPDITRELTEALLIAEPRPVDPARARGKPAKSRIVEASEKQIVLGTAGAGALVIPALEQAEQGSELAHRLLALIGGGERFAVILPWVGLVIFAGMIVLAMRARSARIEDHRTGRTP